MAKIDAPLLVRSARRPSNCPALTAPTLLHTTLHRAGQPPDIPIILGAT